MPPSVMPFPLLYPKIVGNGYAHLKPPPRCHIPSPNITCFDIKIIHQRIKTTRSHTSRCCHCNYCHYYNVHFVELHNVTCYTNLLLSCIHANTTKLHNITCTLVATSVILGRSKCIQCVGNMIK